MNSTPLLFAMGVLLLLAGCRKRSDAILSGNPVAPGQQKTSLEGEWELRVIYGGMLPQGGGPNVKPGQGSRWIFTADTYQVAAKNGPVTIGTYTRLKDSSQQTNRLMDAIQLKEAGNAVIHYEFKTDTLVMYSGMIAADGTIQKYVPVNRRR